MKDSLIVPNSKISNAFLTAAIYGLVSKHPTKLFIRLHCHPVFYFRNVKGGSEIRETATAGIYLFKCEMLFRATNLAKDNCKIETARKEKGMRKGGWIER